MWEDVEGQESFPVSAGFELTTQGLLVQEHNYSATTHPKTLSSCLGDNLYELEDLTIMNSH